MITTGRLLLAVFGQVVATAQEFEPRLGAASSFGAGSFVAGAAAVVLLQALLIGWLLIEHRKRRGAEAEVGERLRAAQTQLVMITHLDRRAVVGEMTAAITHELSQPLAAILHNAQAGERLLESGASSPQEIAQIFADIRRIDLRAAETIQRLRGLLRKKEFERQCVDVNELSREIAALLTPVASSNAVRIKLDLAADMVPITGDRIHLQQVLLNVMVNGIEAMSATPHERRYLTVRTVSVHDHVDVSVEDRGSGISVDTEAQIFEPFYTTKGEGMGMGLAICRLIVEAHGGCIRALNNPDAGATVSFTIPCGELAEGPRSSG